MKSKKCGTCKEEKTTLDFHKDASAPDGLNYSCKVCRNKVSAKYRENNPDRVKAAAKSRYVVHREKEIERCSKWNKDNSAHVAAMRRVRVFGISIEDYEEMSKAQNHLCAICFNPETSVHASGTLKTLAIDHDHETGAIRQLLCSRCNRALGGFWDSIEVLSKALEYLKKHRNLQDQGLSIIPIMKERKEKEG